jgi:hypothetical protein
MFWGLFVFVGIALAAMNSNAFIHIATMLTVSTVSLIFVSRFFIGKVDFTKALKATVMAVVVPMIVFAMLGLQVATPGIGSGALMVSGVLMLVAPIFLSIFVLSVYLECNMSSALIIAILNGVLSNLLLFVVNRALFHTS